MNLVNPRPILFYLVRSIKYVTFKLRPSTNTSTTFSTLGFNRGDFLTVIGFRWSMKPLPSCHFSLPKWDRVSTPKGRSSIWCPFGRVVLDFGVSPGNRRFSTWVTVSTMGSVSFSTLYGTEGRRKVGGQRVVTENNWFESVSFTETSSVKVEVLWGYHLTSSPSHSLPKLPFVGLLTVSWFLNSPPM